MPSPAAMIRTVGPPPAEEAPLTRGIVAVAGSAPPPDGFGTIPCGWGHAAALIGEGDRATVHEWPTAPSKLELCHSSTSSMHRWSSRGCGRATDHFVHVDERIARLASGQHGLVTVGQLRRLGVGRGSIAHRLRVGRLHRVRTGVFAVGHPSLSLEARLLAAVMACGEHAILSHQHAAHLWELLPPWIELDLATINVSVPPGSRRGRRPGLEVHRLAIEDRDRTARRGIPVTSPSRTLVDLASRVAPRTLERAIDQALTDRLVTAPGLHSALDRAGSSRGTRSLRALLAATERFETVTQSELRGGVPGAGSARRPADAGAERPAARTQGRRRLVGPTGSGRARRLPLAPHPPAHGVGLDRGGRPAARRLGPGSIFGSAGLR